MGSHQVLTLLSAAIAAPKVRFLDPLLQHVIVQLRQRIGALHREAAMGRRARRV